MYVECSHVKNRIQNKDESIHDISSQIKDIIGIMLKEGKDKTELWA